jgi:hypothetical protein
MKKEGNTCLSKIRADSVGSLRQWEDVVEERAESVKARGLRQVLAK